LELFKRGDIDISLALDSLTVNSNEKMIYIRNINFDRSTFSKGITHKI
jgi:hypothetical protein